MTVKIKIRCRPTRIKRIGEEIINYQMEGQMATNLAEPKYKHKFAE